MGENPQIIGMLENLRKLSHDFASVSSTQHGCNRSIEFNGCQSG
jgi:hypothetical protein